MERCGRDTPPLRLQTPIVPKISPNSQRWQVLILCSTLGSCQPGLSASRHLSAYRTLAHPSIPMLQERPPSRDFSVLLGTPKRLKSQMKIWRCRGGFVPSGSLSLMSWGPWRFREIAQSLLAQSTPRVPCTDEQKRFRGFLHHLRRYDMTERQWWH